MDYSGRRKGDGGEGEGALDSEASEESFAREFRSSISKL